ncbi:MAG: GNAT family N-acetyltransferase [Sphingobacteriales bacterium]|jgi:ribosomal protein S18 acetylase RimI-like enzyme|nr:GNAT family N-acetyltransferase [Sphingobacteriales bacterium]
MNNNIEYLTAFEDLNKYTFDNFFVGWTNKPQLRTFENILLQSSNKVVAIDLTNNKVIGFIYAITDNYLSAYIPLLEVLPEYQKKGVGTKLLEILMDNLSEFYMIDLSCDIDMVNFYENKGFKKSVAMIKRNYNKINREAEN